MRNRPRATWSIVVSSALMAASCSTGELGGRDRTAGETRDAPTVTVTQVEPSPEEDVPSALEQFSGDGLPEPLIPATDLLDGGPPPDGIPPIDEPRFHEAREVDFLADAEPVLAVEVEGESRAYPVQIMIWHEIVNDVVGGVPVAVTYCPLCNSAVSYERVIDGHETTFGTSGRLFASALVMYDRAT